MIIKLRVNFKFDFDFNGCDFARMPNLSKPNLKPLPPKYMQIPTILNSYYYYL